MNSWRIFLISIVNKLSKFFFVSITEVGKEKGKATQSTKLLSDWPYTTPKLSTFFRLGNYSDILVY